MKNNNTLKNPCIFKDTKNNSYQFFRYKKILFSIKKRNKNNLNYHSGYVYISNEIINKLPIEFIKHIENETKSVYDFNTRIRSKSFYIPENRYSYVSQFKFGFDSLIIKNEKEIENYCRTYRDLLKIINSVLKE